MFSLIEIANPPHRVRGRNDKVCTRDGALVVYNHQVHATPATVYTIFQRRALRVRAGSVSCDQLEAMMATNPERK